MALRESDEYKALRGGGPAGGGGARGRFTRGHCGAAAAAEAGGATCPPERGSSAYSHHQSSLQLGSSPVRGPSASASGVARVRGRPGDRRLCGGRAATLDGLELLGGYGSMLAPMTPRSEDSGVPPPPPPPSWQCEPEARTATTTTEGGGRAAGGRRRRGAHGRVALLTVRWSTAGSGGGWERGGRRRIRLGTLGVIGFTSAALSDPSHAALLRSAVQRAGAPVHFVV